MTLRAGVVLLNCYKKVSIWSNLAQFDRRYY